MSSRRSRSGGSAIVQRRSGGRRGPRGTLPALDLALEVAVGRGDDAHVDLLVALAADAAGTRCSCSTRSSLACDRQRQLADLVEEQRAAVARARTGPACRSRAPVKAPRSWPNSSLSSSVSGSAPQLTATNGLRGARAAVVDRARDELLARAGLALDQHRRVEGRNLPDQRLGDAERPRPANQLTLPRASPEPESESRFFYPCFAPLFPMCPRRRLSDHPKMVLERALRRA